MQTKQTISTRKIVFTALMAALVAVGSALRITLPMDIGGNTSFHLGNIFCALSGILLGPWLGGAAAGLGSAIYDMMNPAYIAECWLTFLMKGAYGLASGMVILCGKKEWGYLRSALATLAGALIYAALYLLKSYLKPMIVQGVTAEAAMLSVIGKIPATVFNAVVALVFAPILAVAIRKALEKNRLTLN